MCGINPPIISKEQTCNYNLLQHSDGWLWQSIKFISTGKQSGQTQSSFAC
jgi:hypothetical protein